MKSGFGELRTFINTGAGFSTQGQKSLPGVLPGEDDFARLATIIDFNADGRQDLLIPLPAAGGKPARTILQATGNVAGETFEPVDAGIPFEAQFLEDEKVSVADPHGPRVTDVDGDEIQDVVVPINGFFHVFKSTLHEEDLLVSVTDGLNAHDPGEPAFLPNVRITYDHLIDKHKTAGEQLGIPEASWTYVSESAHAQDACVYPVRCVVGPRRTSGVLPAVFCRGKRCSGSAPDGLTPPRTPIRRAQS